MTRARATLVGFSAILMWALLAVLTIGTEPVPPLQLNAICFAIGGAIGLVWSGRRGFGVLSTVPLPAYAFGALGLFGAHFLYFTAFRLAPMAETGLIAYLWPILIVLFSGFLPGEKVLPKHLLGAFLAFSGAGLVVLRGGIAVEAQALPGFAVALVFALVWAGYSVFSRRLGRVPTEAVTVYCLLASLLSVVAHLAIEVTVWPLGLGGWIATIGLGVGPVGLAFFAWDIGMKQGDIQLLGVASYAAPLLSTLTLVLAGKAQASLLLLAAAALIAGGAALAARASLKS
jgi:drug/metabolite transporter (DMT)-like permease